MVAIGTTISPKRGIKTTSHRQNHNYTISLLVARKGLEPLQDCSRRILSPLRLPVPPPRQKSIFSHIYTLTLQLSFVKPSRPSLHQMARKSPASETQTNPAPNNGSPHMPHIPAILPSHQSSRSPAYPQFDNSSSFP